MSEKPKRVRARGRRPMRASRGAPALGRLLLDVPRRLVKDGWLPPPGTRFYGGEARHVYFTLTELEDEAARAGLVLEVEASGRLVLTKSAKAVHRPLTRWICVITNMDETAVVAGVVVHAKAVVIARRSRPRPVRLAERRLVDENSDSDPRGRTIRVRHSWL